MYQNNKPLMMTTPLKKTQPVPWTLLALLLLLTSCTQNWPQFRGPGNQMIVSSRNLPDTWSQSDNIRWSSDLEGDSWSSPVVWGNRVFITSAILVKAAPTPQPQDPLPPPQDPPEDLSYLQEVYRWEVSCLDLKSGALLWKQVAKEGSPGAKKHAATTYASETPVTDGKRLYVYFGMNGLYCYDLEGTLLWEKDLGAYPTLNGWGTGSSPVIYKDMLYVQVDNEDHSFLVALKTSDGQEIWRKDRDETTNYSTPVIWKNSLRTELVTGGKTARSYDPRTGELIWELKVNGFYNIPSPVPVQDLLYLGNAGFQDTPGTLFCVRAGAEGDITPPDGESTSSGVVWSNPDAPTENPNPLVYEGLLYVLSSRGGEFSCFDASTGEPVYQEKIPQVAACWASPWAYEDKVFFTDEKGVTQVLKAGRNFEVLHQNVLDDKIWTSVAATRDAWLMKGTEKIYCIAF